MRFVWHSQDVVTTHPESFARFLRSFCHAISGNFAITESCQRDKAAAALACALVEFRLCRFPLHEMLHVCLCTWIAAGVRLSRKRPCERRLCFKASNLARFLLVSCKYLIPGHALLHVTLACTMRTYTECFEQQRSALRSDPDSGSRLQNVKTSLHLEIAQFPNLYHNTRRGNPFLFGSYLRFLIRPIRYKHCCSESLALPDLKFWPFDGVSAGISPRVQELPRR
jgi:hypothetical protein